jgi:hypothetical protein
MKWQKEKTRPRNHTLQIISKFLWRPLCINNQTRWLEKCKIKRVFLESYFYPMGKWVNLRWIDND